MPKLSIVIPTKNRYATLFPVVEALLQYIRGKDYQIVVHDNSDDNAPAEEFFSRYGDDPRIAYYHTTEPLSQSGNSDAALHRATGDYVTFIGDDDLVSPYILDVVEMMERRGIEALVYPIAAYCWSSVQVSNKNKVFSPSMLSLAPGSFEGALTPLRSEHELQHVLDSGGVQIFRLPRVYHGVVSRTVLDKVERKYGAYVVGSCPDMNTSVAIATVTDTYFYLAYPVTVSGISSSSASGMEARGAHRAGLREMVDTGFLPAKVLENWNPLLPYVWTIPTIWAQAATEVLRAGGIDKDIDYARFFAVFFYREKWAKKEGWQAVRRAEKENKTTAMKVRLEGWKYALRRTVGGGVKPLIGRWLKRYASPSRIAGVATPAQCMEILAGTPFLWPEDAPP